jgi:hypothetical protein
MTTMRKPAAKRNQILICIVLSICAHLNAQVENVDIYNPNVDPAKVFADPPESTKPGVLWMWMGCNISREGIRKDLEALKKEGFNRTTMFSLADVTTPWSAVIGKTPTPQMISWTEPWWQMVRYAAEESVRLGMDFGMFNGPSYETSGGPWITPPLSMQEICWSSKEVKGRKHIVLPLDKPRVDPRANMPFPVFNPENGLTEKPVIPARETYYKDIAVLAMPARGAVSIDKVRDISAKMLPNGTLDWDVPEGDWVIYRFGHTTMGALIQPAQPEAVGLECDKMSQEAVNYHMDHIIGEIQKHLGDLIGTGFTHVHYDSYEAGYPTWTPKMREEFLKRRGYDPVPYLAFFAGRFSKEDSLKFDKDFDATVKDLYKDIYYTTVSRKLKEAHLIFLSEPYGGPWRQEDVIPLVHHVMTEFWTNNGVYTPYELEPTVKALRQSGHNLIESEAFTGQPADSRWCEYPAWIKPIGDAAFCAGVNRMVLHRFVHQPWNEKYKPGNTMGQWGTHFDRTQTWWNCGTALVKYWQRCQALLLWGKIAQLQDDFMVSRETDSIRVQSIHRTNPVSDIYFVANTTHHAGTATCSFRISGFQPELWDPVTGSMRNLPRFEEKKGKTEMELRFEDAQSYFIVFRKKSVHNEMPGKLNFPLPKVIADVSTPWMVQFDTTWGGPAEPVQFAILQDWTIRPEKGIKYFSGTAVYQTTFDLTVPPSDIKNGTLFLDLGVVKHVARVFLNQKELGIVWTAPWRVEIPAGSLKGRNNELRIEVTNVWANRLIGDEQEPPDCEWRQGQYFYDSGNYLKEFPDWFLKDQPRPSKGRYCFTTWNYFTKDSPLISSGLMGPVKIVSLE